MYYIAIVFIIFLIIIILYSVSEKNINRCLKELDKIEKEFKSNIRKFYRENYLGKAEKEHSKITQSIIKKKLKAKCNFDKYQHKRTLKRRLIAKVKKLNEDIKKEHTKHQEFEKEYRDFLLYS